MGLGGGLAGRGAPGPVVSVPPSPERGFAFRDALGKGGANQTQSPCAGPRADGGAGVRAGGCSPPRFPAALFPKHLFLGILKYLLVYLLSSNAEGLMRNTWALLPGWKHALQRACGSVPEAHTWLHMDFSNPTAIWHRRGAAKIVCVGSPLASPRARRPRARTAGAQTL